MSKPCKNQLKLSKHFLYRWKERVKKPIPAAKEIDEMVGRGLYLQRCRDLYTARGIKQRILALYWVPDQNFIIKLDEKKGVAVTILTSDTIEEELCNENQIKS